ncbi:MAG: threonine synthase [bacterium]|nr:threonine synthase [bacterium]
MTNIQLIGDISKKTFGTESQIWHGENYELLNLESTHKFDPSKLAGKPNNLWRYSDSIPINNTENCVTFEEGFTPLIPITFSNKNKAWVKQDYLFPTGSYKDRGASVLISKIKELGIKHIVQDSSGNAGASIAAYAKRANISCDIYLPADTSEAKITQIAAYGAKIIKVNGNRKETANQAFEAAKSSYYASHCFNPFFFEGTKTFAYEVCEQLNWKSPDAVVLPAGNGTLLLGCYIGFKELALAGIISKIPKIIAIQTEACQPLKLASESQNFNPQTYESGYTLAEGIAIPNPIRQKQMLDALKQTNGKILLVSETEIIQAWKEMANQGFYIEPTSAATIAGLMKFQEEGNDELVVSLFSGSGLKSTEKIAKILKS